MIKRSATRRFFTKKLIRLFFVAFSGLSSAISAAPTHHLSFDVPENVCAGRTVTIEMKALDEKNILNNLENRRISITIYTVPAQTQEVQFNAGRATIEFKATKEPMLIVAQDSVEPTFVAYQAVEAHCTETK